MCRILQQEKLNHMAGSLLSHTYSLLVKCIVQELKYYKIINSPVYLHLTSQLRHFKYAVVCHIIKLYRDGIII